MLTMVVVCHMKSCSLLTDVPKHETKEEASAVLGEALSSANGVDR